MGCPLAYNRFVLVNSSNASSSIPLRCYFACYEISSQVRTSSHRYLCQSIVGYKKKAQVLLNKHSFISREVGNNLMYLISGTLGCYKMDDIQAGPFIYRGMDQWKQRRTYRKLLIKVHLRVPLIKPCLGFNH